MSKLTAVLILCTLLAGACGVPRASYDEMHQYAKKLRNDSMLLDKRIRQLSDEREYLGTRSATMEQELTQRLQEKEDSLNHKEKLLSEKENNIRDMKARKAEEKDAFETLAKSVYELFNTYDVNEANRHSNCTQIVVEVADRLLFTHGTTRPDPVKAQVFLLKVQKAFEKNPDLNLLVIGHTDSIAGNGRADDSWSSGAAKANSVIRLLHKEYKLPASRLSSGSKGETTALSKSNAGLGRNRVEFVFYSTLIPCIHSKE